MPARKSGKVNVTYKAKYHVRNWSEYERAMTKRSDLIVWFDEDTTPPML